MAITTTTTTLLVPSLAESSRRVRSPRPRGVRASVLCGQASTFGASRSPRGVRSPRPRGVRASVLCSQASAFGASRRVRSPRPRGVRASILCGQASTFGASRSPRGVRSPRLCGQASTFGASRSPRGVRSPRPQSPRFCSVWPGQHFRSLAESSRSPESWPAESALPFCVASARFFNDFLPAHRTKFIILN